MSGIFKDIFGYEDPPGPDPQIGEAAKSNAAIAGRMQDLAEQQYSDQRALTAEYAPLLKDLIAKSVAAQDTATGQSQAAWADYNATWKPVEQKLAADSLAWGSKGRQDQEAERAATGVATTFDQARQDIAQQMQRSGVDAGTIATLSAAGRLEEAKAKAGAADGARRTVEKEGMAYLDNAARFGRNMTSTGIATAGLAAQQGQAAQGGYGTLSAAMAQPAQAAGGLFQGAVGANNAAANLANIGWNQQAAGAASNNAFMGDIIGAGANLAGMYFGSSEKTKVMGKRVKNADDAVEKSPAKHWAYKPGLGDGSTKPRMGPTAESLRDATAGVVSDGKTVDGIAMLGLHHAAIGSHNARLRRIERAVGLADAKGA